MKSRPFVLLLVVLVCWNPLWLRGGTQGGDAQDRPAALTLAQALKRVFDHNPELVVSELEIQAASARVLQAGKKPNPEIEAVSENLSLPGLGSGLFPYTESTFQISQRLELGGKRDLRVRAAEMGVALAASQLEVKKAALIAEASQAFADVLAEQERIANQSELRRLADQSHTIVMERVAAGKVSPVEQTRADVMLAAARLEEEKHRLALLAAKDRLAALWGGSNLDIDAVQGAFEISTAAARIPASCIQNSPELKRAAAERDLRDAELARELANRKPDLVFSAGLRRLNQEDQQVLVAGVSMPLPIFDKHEGAIAEARAHVDQSLSEQKAAEWRLRASLAQARREHEAALLEATTLSQSALPAAKEAAAAVEEGYRLGKFDFINVLDAQRTYAELQGRYIEAVAAGLKAAIEIDRLARCESPSAPPQTGK